MKMTAELKKWLVENCDVKQDATDDEFKKAASEAIVGGSLTPEKLAELTTTKEEEQVNDFQKRMEAMERNLELIAENSKKAAEKPEETLEETTTETKSETDAKTPEKKTPKLKSLDRLFSNIPEGASEEKSIDIRVKEAAENYGTNKTALLYPETTKSDRPHPLAGQRVRGFDGGRAIESISEREQAVCGAWLQFQCATRTSGGSRNIAWGKMSPHAKDLIRYGMDNLKWNGSTCEEWTDNGDYANIVERLLSPQEKQALIDDSTSGGLEAAPIVFDDNVIQTPLLHSELLPLVTQVPLDRGRRIEGVSTGTVTGGWGGIDNTAIALFNTASYVSAFDTTIHRWEGAIRVGLDFLSDTPIDFGQHISAQYGERLLEDLDDVITVGDGTTQPEGVMNKSGTTSVSFGGATSLGNYESLRFGVAKPEHGATVKASAVFCGTEQSYERARAIPVGAADARRVMGQDYDSYSIMNRPYKINESLANTQVFYAILARYRMYRRRGLVMRMSTEGDTLIRNNIMLMVATARYGGQLERGAVAAVTSDAPA